LKAVTFYSNNPFLPAILAVFSVLVYKLLMDWAAVGFGILFSITAEF
jgi:hypothetical protein